MITRRKRRYSVTVESADQLDSTDEAVVDKQLAQNVPSVVGSTIVEESATEDGSDNADAEINVLQVATYNYF